MCCLPCRRLPHQQRTCNRNKKTYISQAAASRGVLLRKKEAIPTSARLRINDLDFMHPPRTGSPTNH
ncbi:uncharacterized protein DFL_009104 [Arthrobotrys flagrans]|uniref:Uncharacterized protein n=1 Tax=Arthrobotrys flagrans TaxID=97331 RepID=A0A436ZQP0_ARTFL|nr:hypothetical protein DFL_009104 [Arthrobotrys flagrans]